MDDDSRTHPSMFQRLRGNQEEAWRSFYTKYRPWLVRWAGAKGVRNARNREEIADEVLLILVQMMPNYDYDPRKGRFRDYLREIVKNAAIRHNRRQGPACNMGVNLWQLIERESSRESLLDGLILNEADGYRQKMTGEVREELGEQAWLAYHLTEDLGLSGAAAAAHIGVTANYVYGLKLRLKKRLDEKMQRYYSD